MVQLENEYGSYGLQTKHCDIAYMAHLRDLVRKYLGPEIIMYTTDGASDDFVRCGMVPEAYITVDFGKDRIKNAPKRQNAPKHQH